MTKSKAPSTAGKSKAPSGGGANMNKVVHPGIRTGPTTATKVDPRAVAAIGAKRGDHTEHGSARNHQQVPPREMGKMAQVELGNAKALAVGRGKPGADRKVHPSGSQGHHGPANPGIAPGPNLSQSGGPGGFGFTKGDR
jgi:hypothetical protein